MIAPQNQGTGSGDHSKDQDRPDPCSPLHIHLKFRSLEKSLAAVTG